MGADLWTRGMYALETYLTERNMTQAGFARMIGCDYVHLHSVLRGKRPPGARLRRATEEATRGRLVVKEKYWFEKPVLPRAPRAKEV